MKMPRTRNPAAQQTTAYRCFLPNLAGLGGACSHGSWYRALYIIMKSARWSRWCQILV